MIVVSMATTNPETQALIEQIVSDSSLEISGLLNEIKGTVHF